MTVRAATSRATYAALEVWSRQADGGYRRVAGPWQARVGRSGVGHAVEGSGRTPAGVWPLGQTFGVGTRNPGTALPWFTADARDAWGSDVRSVRTYNRHVRCRSGTCPFRESHAERLVHYPVAYCYAMFIGYNPPPHVVVGAGSAFFLHVGTGGPTAGCVSVSASRVVWLLRHLRPGAVISIGVGARAYAPVPVRRT
jgi:L,D-peptidoglycan transpeptidase YkuD (ErfK/YbiS/YcfS/YnhG family)